LGSPGPWGIPDPPPPQHLLEDSVREPFGAFQKGFLLLCDGVAFSFLAPHELETLICGQPHLDFQALQVLTLLSTRTLTIDQSHVDVQAMCCRRRCYPLFRFAPHHRRTLRLAGEHQVRRLLRERRDRSPFLGGGACPLHPLSRFARSQADLTHGPAIPPARWCTRSMLRTSVPSSRSPPAVTARRLAASAS
jgi:hypothetical protein